MAEAVVSVAIETLRRLLEEDTKFLSGMSSQVRGLETQLREMTCLLEDADRRRNESKTISNWISETRDLAYRSEDVIETYAIRVSSNKGCLKLLIRMLSCGYIKRIHEIAAEIADIKLEISRVYKSMHEYGTRSIIQGEGTNSTADDENQKLKRRTYPFERDDCFVGMEDDLKSLASLVLDNKIENRVISIWGMGGVGKTTIARKVYNHDEIKSHFESFAWVCITQQCHVRSVMEDVLKQLVPHQKDGNMIMNLSFGELVEQLCEVQRDKRCLIVLDDIWKVEHWDCLKDVFDGHVGLKSKILLTTRNQNVVDVGLKFELGLLNVADAWELLKRKAFSRNHVPDYRTNNLRNYELNLEGLNELETLVGFNSLVHDLKFISNMKNLQRLQATLHDNKALTKIMEDINTKWNNLRESALIIKEGCDLTSTQEGADILNKIITCQNLHSLWIDINIKNFPGICQETQTIFLRIILLTLRNCQIEDDPMGILEKLPCLESLCLWPSSYVGQVMSCSAMGFHQLKTLQLWGLPNLMEWRAEREAMANLCELEISDCPKLDKVPEGLRFISTLEELEISEDCGGGKRVSAKKRGFQQCLPCAFRHHP